ncbi:very short patch repair endonuclease [Coraliomargarita sinensis]|nr:very short patch repair endonuclease [Coraliomargarita sinensis]
MRRIRSKNTRPEQAVRSLLHRAGFRFTVNGPLNRSLPGKPDLVLPRFKIAVLVHGCFWHRHEDCKYAYMPKSRVEFWKEKFRKNVQRDREVVTLLKEAGWQPFVVWECQLKRDTEHVLERFKDMAQKHTNECVESGRAL